MFFVTKTTSSWRKQALKHYMETLLQWELHVKSPCIVLNIISSNVLSLWTSKQNESLSQITLLASILIETTAFTTSTIFLKLQRAKHNTKKPSLFVLCS